jgi:hypothetical protein
MTRGPNRHDDGSSPDDDAPRTPYPEIAWLEPRPSKMGPDKDEWVVPTSTIAFCDALVTEFPELEPNLAEHREDMEGETLPHVFMADVTRWFMERYRAGESRSAKALTDWFDSQYPTADADVRNVIDVSFLENLPWPPDPDAMVSKLLGPHLHQTLLDMQAWRPRS